MIYNPDKWVILKAVRKNGDTIHKVLAAWGGSYLYGASWKLNSGITKVREKKTVFEVEGSSGSVYICHKEMYGTSMLTQGVAQQLIEQGETQGIAVEIMEEDKVLEYFNELIKK